MLQLFLAADRFVLLQKMELAQFFGCQGHVGRHQFIGLERQAFAVIPAFNMGDNGPHNRWVSSF